MDLQNFSFKCFVDAPQQPFPLDACIPIFHQWIQRKSVDGLLIDVADYKHVFHGPGILLVGHDCDYALDMEKGKPGLLYRQKREAKGELGARFYRALERTLKACHLMSQALSVSFRTQSLEFTAYDRLLANPGTHTFEAIQPSLQAAVEHCGLDSEVKLTLEQGDPRALFRIGIEVNPALSHNPL